MSLTFSLESNEMFDVTLVRCIGACKLFLDATSESEIKTSSSNNEARAGHTFVHTIKLVLKVGSVSVSIIIVLARQEVQCPSVREKRSEH